MKKFALWQCVCAVKSSIWSSSLLLRSGSSQVSQIMAPTPHCALKEKNSLQTTLCSQFKQLRSIPYRSYIFMLIYFSVFPRFFGNYDYLNSRDFVWFLTKLNDFFFFEFYSLDIVVCFSCFEPRRKVVQGVSIWSVVF